MKRAMTIAGLALALTACAGGGDVPFAGDGPIDPAASTRQVLDVGAPVDVGGMQLTMTRPVTYRPCQDGCTYPDSARELVSYATVHLRVDNTGSVGASPGFSGSWVSDDGQVLDYTGMASTSCDSLPMDLQPGQWAEGCAMFAVPIGPGELVSDDGVVVEVDPR